MFRFVAHAPHRTAFGLLVFGSLALLGAQQVLGAVAAAQSTEAIDAVHNMRPLAATPPSTSVTTVSSAVSAGQFEELVKPMPSPTLAPTAAPTAPPAPTPQPTAAPAAKLLESGVASTYGESDGFEGKRTACGQVFHTQTVQIAHKSLPCGTLVRVVDASNGNSVDARVTDRGPYVPGRIVDLSWAAFKELDATGPGLLHVDVYVLNE